MHVSESTLDSNTSGTVSPSSRRDMLAIISSRYQYGPFLFFVAQVNTWLLTGWKIFSLLPEAPLRPEARGICRICHMVNPALYAHIYTDYEPPLGSAVPDKHVQRSTGALQRLTNGTSVIAYMCVQRVHLIMAKPRSEQMAPLIRRASQTPSKLVIISCDRDLVKNIIWSSV